MILEIFAAVLALSPARVTRARAADVAVWSREASIRVGAPLEDAKLVAVFAVLESAGDARAVSPDGRDCSIVQLRGWARRGHTCAELTADPVLAIATWLEDLEDLRWKCGSTRRALGALATGRCGGAPKLSARRCALAGGC